MNEIACTFFRTALDNKPKPWDGPWERLAISFKRDRCPTRIPGHELKKGIPSLSGSTYQAGTTRGREHVKAIQLAVLDLDNSKEVANGEFHPSGRPVMVKVPLDQPAKLGEVVGHLETQGIAAYAWSTWSSSPKWPRSRVVLPLENPVPPDLWPQAAEWIMNFSGLNAWRECLDMPVLRDLARLHFLPAQRPGGPSVERRESKGNLLLVPLEALSAVLVPEPSLQPWQREHLARRGSGGQSWASWFKGSDGTPLDLRTLDARRLLQVLGCRLGQGHTWRGGMKFRTSCPWAEEHSHGLDDDAGVLFLEPGRWPTWFCCHSHHGHLGLFDLLEAAGLLNG